MLDTIIRVRDDTPIGRISPRLYGHFAEHLGRCCYGGLCMDARNSSIPQQNGFRADVLQALRDLPVPLLRWPGGCYADHYHWRDGIGPLGDRPRRLGMSCDLQVEDDNSLGTHEFMWLCSFIGAEPYLAGNVATGSPQELCDWLEYCNSPLDTTLARLRAADGSPSPFGVKLWGVGNENWGCGGNFDAVTYTHEYRRYATMLRHIDPSAELVACGYEDDWNAALLDTLGDHLDLVDHLSIHRYWTGGGPEKRFTEEDYYALLAEADATEAFVGRTAEIIAEATEGKGKGKRRIGIALDEWGVWHPEARPWGPGADARSPVTYEQAGTLRDALAAGIALEGFHRQCGVLSLANLAQIVNVLHAPVMTTGERMWVTPTYHVLRLHAPHIGALALPVEVEQGDSLPAGALRASRPSRAVSATASQTEGGLAVTVINRHLREAARLEVVCPDGLVQASGRLLAAASPEADNSAEDPDRVSPVPFPVSKDGGDGWRVELPPHSLATIVLRRG
jgi:alpha-L-arabinofuranosidase